MAELVRAAPPRHAAGGWLQPAVCGHLHSLCPLSEGLPSGHAAVLPRRAAPAQASMLEEGVLERAASGVWGASSKPDRYSK